MTLIRSPGERARWTAAAVVLGLLGAGWTSWPAAGSSGSGGGRQAPRADLRRGHSDTLLAQSGDAYVRQERTADGFRWRFGTAQIEKQVQFAAGRLALVHFTDVAHRHEYVQEPVDVAAFTWDGQPVTGPSAQWTFDGVETATLKQGELLFRLKLHTSTVTIVKHYLLYPQESIIQEWLQIVNSSTQDRTLTDPASLTLRIAKGEAAAIDFSYLIGAPIDTTRYRPQTERAAGFERTFEGTGSEQYSPIQIYQNRETQLGVFVGWDYIGAWQSNVKQAGDGPIETDFRLPNYERSLKPGAAVELPKTFTGVFRGDWDEMGHQLLDYQYRYKWDYTRAPYFAGVEMEPSWAGASWTQNFNPVTLYRQVFHMMDLLRAVGADIYWRDNGWWSNQGDWDGPNWAETRRYLAQHDMRQVLYIPIQDVEETSKVGQQHPDWIGGGSSGGPIVDQGKPEVIDWQLQMLESRQRLWGDFQWRKDWGVISGESADNLEQDHGWRRLLTSFLDRNAGMVYHGCHTGAFDLGYEHLRMAVSWSMNDDYPQNQRTDRVSGYYASYLYPPDKLEDLPDGWKPDSFVKAVWRGRLWTRMSTQGETDDPEKREGLRELFDIYHYALKAGVYGRWGWVYRPKVTGDNQVYYLERLSGDYKRGMIIPIRGTTGPVTIYPKGLLPNESYHVSYQETPATETRSGADLMAKGIALPSVPPAELIYLNLPLHPGSPADRTAPQPPKAATQQVVTHMDFTGVALRWQPATDDNWISYYEIQRNGVPIDKVAKGTYYFDHALGADPAARYAVVAVDGSGNRSTPAEASGIVGTPATVLDDTSRALTYGGNGWEHQTGVRVVAHGTQARTRTSGDAVSVPFEGSRVTWYGRFGPDQGAAAVYIDDKLDRVVDLYDLQVVPNVAVFDRVFPAVEKHTLKIVALGPSAEADSAGWISIDGIQVDRAAPRVAERPAESYTFTGRGIVWVGQRCSGCGMADVFVDGELVAAVDLYVQPLGPLAAGRGTSDQRNVPVFTHQWPTAGSHTIKIVPRTDANLWATGRTVPLDAFYVIP